MTTAESRLAAVWRLHKAFAAEKGETWLRYQGRSMAPLLQDGDLLRVRQVARGAVRAGDIVAFTAGERSVVHRLLRARQRGAVLVTKGDNTWRLDRPFGSEQLLGKVCEIRRDEARIGLEHGGWCWTSRMIAASSLIESIAFRFAAAFARRAVPEWVFSRTNRLRLIEALAARRRAALGGLYRAIELRRR
jgi:hypothetical protein